jgi:hypothetical protein
MPKGKVDKTPVFFSTYSAYEAAMALSWYAR